MSLASPVFILANAIAPAPGTSQIVVHGTGTVETLPDTATIGFSLRGEARTSDDAVRSVNDNRKSIVDAVSAIAPVVLHDGELALQPVRGEDCKRDYGKEMLSAGPCAILGYVATMDVTVQTSSVKDAATLVSLIGRLKGYEPSVKAFRIGDDASARRAAIAEAVKDARGSAEALARATGSSLGRIISMSDTLEPGDRSDELRPPAPRQEAAPSVKIEQHVEVPITPAPIETKASVTVTYELLP
ncbi:SIMPL domain-containing protein [Novosphingobium flavum]|uniref:SIMPL domain-containing protein n=1 Tax=Novosphingobium flavum TaxID=1778672 RepID=A0A7X1FU09_9SPHN|nr:SIMPL domain-containing protein [Novosphingobium flavum]MBC2666948.1 SIMPL domain-containing protein [Novosphingobium flavum]